MTSFENDWAQEAKLEKKSRFKALTLKARAVQYLARREHSRRELRTKLLRYMAESETADDVDCLLDELEAKGFLSDERYATSRARVRSQKYGQARIAFELRSQGVDAETIAEVVEPLKETEAARARALWVKRFKGVAAEDQKERARHIRYLAARGFTFDVISKVIAGADDDLENEI